MESKGIDRDEYNAHEDPEQDVDKGDNEPFRIGTDFREGGEGFPATLVLEVAERESHGMFEAIGEDGGAEFLDDDVAEVILKGFGDTGDHGYAHEHAQVIEEGPEELGLGAVACFMEDLGMGVEGAGLFGVGSEDVHYSSEKVGVQHGKGLVDGCQQESPQDQPAIGF